MDENVSQPISALQIVLKLKPRFPSPICTQSPHTYFKSLKPPFPRESKGENMFEKGHNGVDLHPKPGYFGDVSTSFTHERPAGSLVTVFLVSFEEELRSPSNLVVPCALMLLREKFWSRL